jgi:phage recombination protein Bet
MNAPAIISQPALSDAQLATVLENSLYPGANPQSISLAITYCHAAGLDPMQKPVHIVPMWDGKAKRMRDVIMPGVGLYRTQAARTGQYAGVTEPEFGPDVTEELGGQKITYPAWCKVSVKRMMPNGAIVEFAATERWKENYAIKGGQEKSIAPNAMWSKRPYGQLAKCTEAQALRKAFPEMTGSQPTADEMEGKPLEYDAGQTIDNATGEIVKQETKVPEPWPDDKFKAVIEKHGPLVKAGTKTADDLLAWLNAKHPYTAEQEAVVRALAPKEAA